MARPLRIEFDGANIMGTVSLILAFNRWIQAFRQEALSWQEWISARISAKVLSFISTAMARSRCEAAPKMYFLSPLLSDFQDSVRYIPTTILLVSVKLRVFAVSFDFTNFEPKSGFPLRVFPWQSFYFLTITFFRVPFFCVCPAVGFYFMPPYTASASSP